MLTTDPLSSRVVSAFPISVATSLAVESILKGPNPCIDPERVIPQQIDITKYNEFYINISTLYRNIIGALSKEDYLRVGASAIKETIAFEMELIDSIFKNEGGNTTKVIFYACQYKSALSKSKHPHAIFRSISTEKQKEYKNLHDETISLFLKNNVASDSLKIFDSEIKSSINGSKALFLTHIPFDLLSYKNFRLLDLVESHTGVLKNSHQWYTKYNDGKVLNMIPFTCGFLQVFGDTEFYKPFDIRIRKTIIELANNCRWSQVTKIDKIKQDLDNLKDHFLRETLKEMVRE